MSERITQQDIMFSSFKLSIEREKELIEKCKSYKKRNNDERVSNLIQSFFRRSEEHIAKVKELIENLALNYTAEKKMLLTDIDKLQILLKDKIEIQELYNQLSIKNKSPEVRKLFIRLRDSNAEDVYDIQQKIEHMISVEKPVSKSIE